MVPFLVLGFFVSLCGHLSVYGFILHNAGISGRPKPKNEARRATFRSASFNCYPFNGGKIMDEKEFKEHFTVTFLATYEYL